MDGTLTQILDDLFSLKQLYLAEVDKAKTLEEAYGAMRTANDALTNHLYAAKQEVELHKLELQSLSLTLKQRQQDEQTRIVEARRAKAAAEAAQPRTRSKRE